MPSILVYNLNFAKFVIISRASVALRKQHQFSYILLFVSIANSFLQSTTKHETRERERKKIELKQLSIKEKSTLIYVEKNTYKIFMCRCSSI